MNDRLLLAVAAAGFLGAAAGFAAATMLRSPCPCEQADPVELPVDLETGD